MFSIFTITLMATFCCCTSVVSDDKKCIVPFEFTKCFSSAMHWFKSNSTQLNSSLIEAEEFTSLIRISAPVQCSNNMLMVATERTITRTPKGFSVVYNVTVNIQEQYRYNKSLLNHDLYIIVRNCYEKVFIAMETTYGFENNITRYPITHDGFPQLGPDDHICISEIPVCPTRSNEINGTCECSNGSYCDMKICKPCPKDTYQYLSGTVQCTPCPDAKITWSTGARSLADCRTNSTTSRTDSTTSRKYSTTSRTNSTTNYALIIGLSIAAAVLVLLVLIIATKFFINRRKRNTMIKKFKENFQVYDNPTVVDECDEERDVEHCGTLGDLEKVVLERGLEIPRDCIKLTGVTLGRGNFGEVHQVLVKRNDKPEILCAAKMAKGGSHVTIQDVLEELDTHLKLEKNPNVVNLLGVCSGDDGPFYLLMEYCDNGSLEKFLKDHKEMPKYVNTAGKQTLTLEWKLQRSLEVCNGMKFLANKRIVHRDVAARNVLLDSNMVAKVSDFGMAKDIYVKSYYKQRHEGSFPLRWMAIESIDSLSFTEKTDVWSFGVLVWEIFTNGKLPYYFIIDDEKVAQYILIGKKLKRPTKCPKSLFRIILKCWNDNDYDRPKFRELYEKIDLYIKNETVREHISF